MATITIRLDNELKEQASEVAKYYGFDLGSVTRAFYSQMVRDYSIPLKLNREEPNEESMRSIAEAHEAIKAGNYKVYDDIDSLLADAGAQS